MDRNTGRTEPSPPQRVDAERATLGGLLLRPASFAAVAAAIDASDFLSPTHGAIFAALWEFNREQLPFDLAEIAKKLAAEGTWAAVEAAEVYLRGLVDEVLKTEDIIRSARRIREESLMARVVKIASALQEREQVIFDDYKPLFETVESLIGHIGQQSSPAGLSTVGADMPALIDSIEMNARGPRELTGVPTGFTRLDELTGGLQPGTLVTISSPPGVGKLLALELPSHWITKLALYENRQKAAIRS